MAGAALSYTTARGLLKQPYKQELAKRERPYPQIRRGGVAISFPVLQHLQTITILSWRLWSAISLYS